jgi:hypothetical protein
VALQSCRECGANVSTEAQTCPRCGVPSPTGNVAATPRPAAQVVLQSTDTDLKSIHSPANNLGNSPSPMAGEPNNGGRPAAAHSQSETTAAVKKSIPKSKALDWLIIGIIVLAIGIPVLVLLFPPAEQYASSEVHQDSLDATASSQEPVTLPPSPANPLPAATRTGLFGVLIPTGARLISSLPETTAQDATEAYQTSLSASAIRDFYRKEIRRSGWTNEGGVSNRDMGVEVLNFSKPSMLLAIVINLDGGSFVLMGGHR